MLKSIRIVKVPDTKRTYEEQKKIQEEGFSPLGSFTFERYVREVVNLKEPLDYNKNSVDFLLWDIRYNVFGTKKESDVAPYINDDNSTMMPIRSVSEAFNASVDWDQNTKTATLKSSNKTITIKLGDKFMTVDGKKVNLDSPAIAYSGRTFLPIRAIGEALGVKVNWIASEQRRSITK